MECVLCKSKDLRTSRLRESDGLRFFLLKYPVRCNACRERQYVNVFKALELRKTRNARRS